ncbi:MAG TPA: diacylglycerol kinase family protein [Candidatus Dojkabacteria bacterium]|nr:diacylglycerol kinase family protein [Candidatus Dojkabacteria bacterium]
MKNSKYKAEDFFKSQGYARNGIRLIFRNERNFRIDLIVAVVVVCFGFVLKISHYEWIGISLVISMVLASEAINSAIEAICDTVSTDYRVNVKYAKDVSAGAVLVSVLVSVVTGIIVFMPHIIELFS